MDYKKIKVSDYKKERGISDEFEFKGYAVHLEKSDEFLAAESENGDVCLRSWAKTPMLAKLYQSQNKAEKSAKRAKNGAVMALVFEGPDSYHVDVHGKKKI